MNSGDATELPLYGLMAPEDDDAAALSRHLESIPLLYSNLSILRDKVQQLESVLSLFISSPVADSAAIPALLQEIILTASSALFGYQQATLPGAGGEHQRRGGDVEALDETASWYAPDDSFPDWNNSHQAAVDSGPAAEGVPCPNPSCEIIEIAAADLLAKYTHYCAVCGKGFKRDANLRMHMRAHGDQYKSSAALSNPGKAGDHADGVGGGAAAAEAKTRRKYSCPQEGCRWNQRHAKFQPLKSMICVKNHYRRSHCPKMYICKRCNGKRFSVVSDLRTHEKHCGDAKWRCSCGTTFSRKDKLMGHVALFVGHAPLAAADVRAGGSMRPPPPPFGEVKDQGDAYLY